MMQEWEKQRVVCSPNSVYRITFASVTDWVKLKVENVKLKKNNWGQVPLFFGSAPSYYLKLS